ncbi:sensor histidine kinase [Noviherbaspirillum galbum]|uniref:histidine kinase n=1 Tax=Noviherbaspirillum galbum TaxID=2709383 RepID=A0A6B3SWW8_9BURK|nr:ATP-binding protein [Noviherbaspirillum galbum]NEX63985.1 HAMP domain-containing protein [Noviherbaspirillum galbum]
MRSIYLRLNLLYVIIVTTVLAISGASSYYGLRYDLERRHDELRSGLLTRLQSSAPLALWDFDTDKINGLLDGEMLPSEVLAICVFDTSGNLFAGKMRADDGGVTTAALTKLPAGETVDAPLLFQRRDTNGASSNQIKVGRVSIVFSRAAIARTLQEAVARKALEILVLDVLLVVALSLGLRMVFAPLRQLKSGLFTLASDSSHDVDELPEDRQDEIGDLVRAFNRILRRLKEIINQTRKAEESARLASAETAKAYDDLRMAQASLLEAERLASLGGLVAGVAHEINTPVGITLTSASVLREATGAIQERMREGGMKKSDLAGYVETADESTRLILANAERAAQLIQSFKQIAVDQTNEARRSFTLHAYLNEVTTSLNPRIKKSRVRVLVDCPEDIAIDSYPGALAQIVTNLIMNALVHAFGPEQPGTITIRARQSAGQVELLFADDGKGIAPENISKIFEPFFTTQRGHGGTGLGLNIVYNLVAKQFGGTVKVDSRLGHGTRFTISFPATAPQEEFA